jgi:hypothetical protein
MNTHTSCKFFFGVEHEVAFLKPGGEFADFSNTQFRDFEQIIEKLPVYPKDYPQLKIGSAGIKKKRWYIEGFERFADSEQVIRCEVKGIEIRTSIHSDIHGAIAELTSSFKLLSKIAAEFGLLPVLTSFNPHYQSFDPKPPLNAYELKRRQASPEKQTANIAMLTYGPDLNISIADMAYKDLLDAGQKLTYYSPWIIPFSFSSPFYLSQLWSGLSVRTFMRTGKRPSAMIFVEKPEQLITSNPSLTKIARISAEVGRIEFKAFDSCDNFAIYAALLALLKGLILDKTLPGRAIIPDVNQHQTSAIFAFDNQKVLAMCTQILQVAEQALIDDPDLYLLHPLHKMLLDRKTKAHELIESFYKTGSIIETLKNTY